VAKELAEKRVSNPLLISPLVRGRKNIYYNKKNAGIILAFF